MTSETYDFVVVGAGVFGSWSAYQLAQTGASVLLVDQYGPGNSRSSSGGETRIMRLGYGPDEVYMRSAQRSLGLWRAAFDRADRELFHRTGVLWLAQAADEYSERTVANFERLGVAFERLTREDLLKRYPQIDLGSVAWAVLEIDAGALMARQAVQVIVQLAIDVGATYINDAVLAPEREGKLDLLVTRGGRKLQAGHFVFACGPWLPKVFPDVLGDLIHVTRQEVCFFGVPPGDVRFSQTEMPIWIDFNDLVYVIPDIDGRGLKLAIDAHGCAFDPDTGERSISNDGLEAARKILARRLPALANAPLLESRVCQYENTWNGDLLIDRHPSSANVWFVGGGSGHGFKHGPSVGKYLTDLVLGGGRVEPRFTLATKQLTQSRAVF